MVRARLAGALAALAATLYAAVGHGLVNYDTLYTLVWGRGLAGGDLPDGDVPLAPTAHPLATVGGLLLAPVTALTRDGIDGEITLAIVLVFAFGALAALGVVVARLGAATFHPAVGLLAAAILLTRRPVLDFGARAYVDIPFLVLVLAAAVLEARRPRAGVPVLGLLAVAGLIRPEAWLFSAVYLLWLRRWDPRLLALAALGPLGWAAYDLLTTGNPLDSLSGTQENAETLQRVTGLDDVPGTVPRRLGEILREPVLLAAVGGLGFSALWLRERMRLPAALGVVGLLAFCVLAAAGLPILGRYLLLPAAVGALFAAVGVLGWLVLDPSDPRRRPWQAFGALCAVVFVLFAPGQVDRITGLRDALRIQSTIQADLADLLRDGVPAGCDGLTVPNRRPIPLLALWLDREPQTLTSTQDGASAPGVVLAPANPQIARDYILDRRDLRQAVPPPPAGSIPVRANASWRLLRNGC